MGNFSGHEGQASIVVRGTMHHAVMTETEFNEWLSREDCYITRWFRHGIFTDKCLIKRRDHSVRSIAMKIHPDIFGE